MEDITAKNRKLKFLSVKLEEVANIGLSEFSVAALFILGELHENIATDILNAPYPQNITNAEKADIKKQLVEVSNPLFKDAKNFYKRSYDLSQKINTFSNWTIKAARKIKEIDPEIFASSELETVKPDYLSHEIIFTEMTEPLLR